MADTDSNEYFKKNTSKCNITANFDALFYQLRLRKMISIIAKMSDFKAKNALNSISAGTLPQTLLESFTALPQTS